MEAAVLSVLCSVASRPRLLNPEVKSVKAEPKDAGLVRKDDPGARDSLQGPSLTDGPQGLHPHEDSGLRSLGQCLATAPISVFSFRDLESCC